MIRVVRDAELERGLRVDALVRAVDAALDGLTAWDRTIGLRAGEAALAPLASIGEGLVGGAFVTPAGALPASFLIHVVLRAPDDPVSPRGVRRAFLNALRRAAEWELAVVAAPPLGTGAGNLDAEAAAALMSEVAHEHRREADFPHEVVVVVRSDYEEDAFLRAAAPER